MQSIFALIRSFFQKILTFLRLRGVGPVIIEEPDDGADYPVTNAVPYYGCPNSKKADRLRLNKKSYR